MKFIHIYDRKSSRGGLTVAYTVEKIENYYVISMGAAFCSPQDQYCKQVGREISTIRQKTQPLQIISRQEGTPTSQEIGTLFYVFLLEDAPERLRELSVYTSPLRPARFNKRAISEFLGPEGSLINVSIDVQDEREENTVLNRPVRAGWLDSIPGWAKTYLTRVRE